MLTSWVDFFSIHGGNACSPSLSIGVDGSLRDSYNLFYHFQKSPGWVQVSTRQIDDLVHMLPTVILLVAITAGSVN